MITVRVPIFDEFNKYCVTDFKNVKLKKSMDRAEMNKITRLLPGFCQGYVPGERLLNEGRVAIQAFYDGRQRTKWAKGYFVEVVTKND